VKSRLLADVTAQSSEESDDEVIVDDDEEVEAPSGPVEYPIGSPPPPPPEFAGVIAEAHRMLKAYYNVGTGVCMLPVFGV
jgi:hypothetical protein